MIAIPATEQVLCCFVAQLDDEKLKYSTIKTYLSGVRFLHIAEGHPNPFVGALPRLDYVLRGVKKREVEHGVVRKQRLPISPDILRRIQQVWSSAAALPDTIMLWAACTLCFFGFLRAGEMMVSNDGAYDPSVHLSVGDIAVDDVRTPRVLRVAIKQSKTDPFCHGLFIGRTSTDLCPVAALLSYLVVRGRSPGPLFRYADGRVLTLQRFVKAVRDAL